MKITKLMLAMAVTSGTLLGCGGKEAISPAGDNQEAAASTATPAAKGDATFIIKNEFGQEVRAFARRDSAGRQYAPILDTTASFQLDDATHRAYKDLYWSKADPVNKEWLAASLNNAYANEKDSFKRQDMLASLEPEMKAYLDRVHAIGDIAVLTKAPAIIQSYDMEKKAYPMFGFIGFESIEVPENESKQNRYTVAILTQRIAPDSAPYLIKMDEAKAREIESQISALRDETGVARLQVRVKGSVMWAGAAVDSGMGEFTSVIKPDALELVHPKTKQTLFTLESKDLPPMAVDYVKLKEGIAGAGVFESFRNKYEIPYE